MISLNINLYLKIIILITYIVRHPLRQRYDNRYLETPTRPAQMISLAGFLLSVANHGKCE